MEWTPPDGPSPGRPRAVPFFPMSTAVLSAEGPLPAAGPDLSNYLLVCAGLLAFVLALAWFFRRFVAESVRRRAAKRSLQVIDVLPLGGKQKLMVVRCYDRNFLLGAGDKEIRSIAELDPEAVAAPVASAAPEPPEPADDIEPAPFAESLIDALEAPTELRPKDLARVRRWKRGEGILG